jgi:UDP-N-acetylmuramyl pentapeptide synthase
MSAALAAVVAAAGEGNAFAVLGDMRELGPDAEARHRELGAEAAQRLAGLIAVGEHAATMVAGARAAGLARAEVASSPEAAAIAVAAWTTLGDWILVKASRGMRLERTVDALRAALDPDLESP